MYVILFDLDTSCLEESYKGNTYHGAYSEVKKFLLSKGFEWKQGSVYFAKSSMNAVDCVLVVQDLARTYPWFAACVKDVRMLRIEENNDLMPAIDPS
ncbi:MAG: virulence factor [Ekhidna sp.]|nr:virulence factor [Ekhidna sp.]MBC6410715.1 virulence factor [Ekhidna sp.]MBC6426464.1 virulence factor [Ekhidna sp.]